MRLMLLLALCFSALFYSTRSDAQDVYNFYFQKNMPFSPQGTTTAPAAPTSIAQPAPGAPATLAAPAPSPATAAAPAPLKKFELGLGYASQSYAKAYTSDGPADGFVRDGGAGFGLVAGYRLNKYFALDLAASVTNNHESEETRRMPQGSFGLVVTPIHINLFGFEFIELSATGGAMSGQRMTAKAGGGVITSSDDGTVASTTTEEQILKKETVFGAYAGGRLGLNLTSELGLFLDYKQMLGAENREIAMGMAGLKYRF